MSEIVLLAPGPSMSQALVDSVRGRRVGVVSNVFELAPWAEFLAAQDMKWWRAYPAAEHFAGRKFSANRISNVETINSGGITTASNSGVLALEAARLLGCTRVLLLGFDMHGSHFFGEYKNGLRNTTDVRRALHLKQYRAWAQAHPRVEVVNCTPGSQLAVFPMGVL